ncbi:MAG TPA: xyloglucanase [Bryobacteraceae bacterium]|nr:xyloglucanase [Bryobacteraceae bacterium]
MLANRKFLAALAFVLAAVASLVAQGNRPAVEPYTWKSVQIVGGGFVDGIVFHPTARGVRYARTDMGSAYRWNGQAKRWDPLLDWVPYEDLNLMGVESIALDPADPNRLYMACGTYTNAGTPNGAILRSKNRGQTFERTNVPFKFGGNEDGRGNGERMSVDPNDGNVLYLGTRQVGLWKSTDGAVTWSRVDSFPDVAEAPPAGAAAAPGPGRGPRPSRGAGIVVTLFDPRSGSKGKGSSTLYVAASLMGRDNLFRSTDAGKTWQAAPGQPTQYRPTHMVMAPDGILYLSYGTSPGPSRMTDGAVWKFDPAAGAWTDITPVKPDPAQNQTFGYAAVAVDAHNPKVVIASTFGRMNGNGGEDDMFRSIDGGAHWKPVFGGTAATGGAGTFDGSLAPYVMRTPIHWMFDIEIDPADPKHAMFTTGYGGWETFNLTNMDANQPTRWSVMATGIEETVPLDLCSPTKGAHLISAVGDYGGFTHWDLDKPAPEGANEPPLFNNTTGAACAENKPEVVVRVGVSSHHHPGFNISYSLDSGKTWQPPAAMPQPESRGGSLALSADGATWVWSLQSGVYVTRDNGATWTQAQGLPNGMRLAADRVNPKKFYGMSLFDGKLFLSADGAATFTQRDFTLPDGLPRRAGRGDNRGGQDRVYTTPGKEGDLWIAAFNGLYHSTDSGATFARMDGVSEVHAFGFGKAAPGADSAALYLVGTVNGQGGILRSIDTAKSWVRINDDRHQWGLVLQITGDPKQYGRVYVGSHGRGIVYGDPPKK